MPSLSLKTILDRYDYTYPKHLIAQIPASPRDSAKLLVYNRKTKEVTQSAFAALPQLLPQNTLLVFNNTKVIPARLHARRETGENVEIFFLSRAGSHRISALTNKKLKTGERLFLGKGYTFTVLSQEKSTCLLEPSFPTKRIPDILHRFGSAPLPPYLRHSPLTEDRRRRQYQSIFAKKEGAIAAPTASLHFTKLLLRRLNQSGVETAVITLHVGLGTFAPLNEDQWRSGKLHAETYSISKSAAERINKAKANGRPIIAVGTTVVRTLESAGRSGTVHRGTAQTSLFIRPPFTFHLVSGLITNFHVPRSSLIMLVSAFVGRKRLLSLYETAIAQQYRLFSFGDGMLIV